MPDDEAAAHYACRVGERLRAIRKQKDLSLQDVELASADEFKASVLGAYERGERAISVPRLQRLARFYAVPVDQLLPHDGNEPIVDLVSNGATSAAERPVDDRDDPVRIDLTRLDVLASPEREFLTRYVTQIQRQREDYNGRVLTIRRDDLRALACMFELPAELLPRRLNDLGVRLPG